MFKFDLPKEIYDLHPSKTINCLNEKKKTNTCETKNTFLEYFFVISVYSVYCHSPNTDRDVLHSLKILSRARGLP